MNDSRPGSFIAYTDGACRGNPGQGAWAFVVLSDIDSPVTKCSGHESKTTNQRMEVLAAINAISSCIPGSDVLIHSDSAYLCNCMINKWYVKWQENGWVNSAGKPVANVDLWKRLIDLIYIYHVGFVKVNGHDGVRWNEECDKLCNEMMDYYQ